MACSKCGAVMMIDMDGRPQLAEHNTPSEPDASSGIENASFESASPAPDDSFAPVEDPSSGFAGESTQAWSANPAPDQDAFASETPSWDAGAGAFEAVAEPSGSYDEPASGEEPFEGAAGFAPAEEEGLEAAEPEASDAAEEGAAGAAESNDWFEQSLGDAPAAAVPPSGGVFSDVESFGNQDAETNALQFELSLEGIDLSDVRADVLEALSDPRLFLNTSEIAESIQAGKLVIPGLSAARVSLIVTRLQHLDLKFKWRQRLYEA